MTARKDTGNVKVIVRTDAVFHNGQHYHYGQTVAVPADVAKRLTSSGQAEKA